MWGEARMFLSFFFYPLFMGVEDVVKYKRFLHNNLEDEVVGFSLLIMKSSWLVSTR